MSNIETHPDELRFGPHDSTGADQVEVMTAREVPLGGPRAMTVRRTLPQKHRSLIGAWCFADHYGPDDVTASGGMDVAPHPHTGLQTVSWLFSGAVEHRDSAGVHAIVRPGELNLMTSGAGIAHSEVSTPETVVLHGVQLWLALPNAVRTGPRDFQHYAPEPVTINGATVRVFLGTLAGAQSPVVTFSPLLGAEIVLPAHTDLEVAVDPGFEHGVLVDTGTIVMAGAELVRSELGYLGTGHSDLALANRTAGTARVIILGGQPFAEEILMWWNFVGRSHEEIVAFRDAWQRESGQFGAVEGYRGRVDRLPAPELPGLRLRPRRNRPA
jgi:redox-sensitive bicupin YhaK (pirin superfamily)